jgi:hypothetical protein
MISSRAFAKKVEKSFRRPLGGPEGIRIPFPARSVFPTREAGLGAGRPRTPVPGGRGLLWSSRFRLSRQPRRGVATSRVLPRGASERTPTREILAGSVVSPPRGAGNERSPPCVRWARRWEDPSALRRDGAQPPPGEEEVRPYRETSVQPGDHYPKSTE